MSATFITDNIHNLRVIALAPPRGWIVRFDSSNDTLHHQMYVNGELADFTDSIAQRRFHLDAEGFGQLVASAAVDAAHRMVDMSDRLGDAGRPGWVYRTTVVRPALADRSARLELLGDRATGLIGQEPLASRKLSPAWLRRWGFGYQSFALGQLGYDGHGSPGAGRGGFGAGGFGFGAELLRIAYPANEPGTHQMRLRAASTISGQADGQIEQFDCTPPPAAPASITATAYDSQTETLTVQIQ